MADVNRTPDSVAPDVTGAKTAVLYVRLPADLKAQVEALAAEFGRSQTRTVAALLAFALANPKTREAFETARRIGL